MLGGRSWRAVAAATTTMAVALSGTAAPTTARTATAGTAAPGPPGGIGVTDLLGPEGEPLIEVSEINERGQVLGRVDRPPAGWFPYSAAVLWHRGEAREIHPPPAPPPSSSGVLTVPAEISDRGVIAGDRIHVSGFVRWPFSWSGGVYTGLEPAEAPVSGLTGTAPAVNERGQVLSGRLQAVADPDDPFAIRIDASLTLWEGYRAVATSDADAYPVDLNDQGRAAVDVLVSPDGLTRQAGVWRIGGAVTRLGTLGGAQSHAAAINERGDIVGTGDTATGDQHAFVWRNGRMTDLGTLGGPTTVIGAPSEAAFWFPIGDHALNEWGDVVGTSTTAAGDEHAFLWRNGRMTDLGTLGGTASRAIAVNGWGQVVGTSQTASGQWHAFLWQAGRMTDLGALAGEGRSAAIDLNDRGQVIGRVAGRGGVLWTLPPWSGWLSSLRAPR
jgi:probable HAF family extracellular repeat protein